MKESTEFYLSYCLDERKALNSTCPIVLMKESTELYLTYCLDEGRVEMLKSVMLFIYFYHTSCYEQDKKEF